MIAEGHPLRTCLHKGWLIHLLQVESILGRKHKTIGHLLPLDEGTRFLVIPQTHLPGIAPSALVLLCKVDRAGKADGHLFAVRQRHPAQPEASALRGACGYFSHQPIGLPCLSPVFAQGNNHGNGEALHGDIAGAGELDFPLNGVSALFISTRALKAALSFRHKPETSLSLFGSLPVAQDLHTLPPSRKGTYGEFHPLCLQSAAQGGTYGCTLGQGELSRAGHQKYKQFLLHFLCFYRDSFCNKVSFATSGFYSTCKFTTFSDSMCQIS